MRAHNVRCSSSLHHRRPRRFAAKLAAARPFASPEAVHEAALRVWCNEACHARRPLAGLRQSAHAATQVGVAGWLEAFAAHPRIGDVESLRKKFAATSEWWVVPLRGAPA